MVRREVSFRAVLVALALPSIACYLLLVHSTNPRLAEEGEARLLLCFVCLAGAGELLALFAELNVTY